MSCLCFVFSLTKLVRKFCSHLNSFRSYFISFFILFSPFYFILFLVHFFLHLNLFWRPMLGPMATQFQPIYWPWNSGPAHPPLQPALDLTIGCLSTGFLPNTRTQLGRPSLPPARPLHPCIRCLPNLHGSIVQAKITTATLLKTQSS